MLVRILLMTRKTLLKLILGLIATMLTLGVLFFIGNISIDKLPISKKGKQLRIVSMNVRADNILPISYQDNLIQTQPDIIIIIEWTGNNIDLTKFEKAGYLTILNQPIKKVHGLCILSKTEGQATILGAPIQTPCTFPLGQFRFKWQDSSITLFAIHAPPPVPACKGTTSDYLKAVADWVENGRLSYDFGIGQAGDNLILAGDFNSISFDSGIKTLKSKHLQDNYSKYNIISPTWKPFKTFPYIAKIDYIIFSDRFKNAISHRFFYRKFRPCWLSDRLILLDWKKNWLKQLSVCRVHRTFDDRPVESAVDRIIFPFFLLQTI